jgi:hypothetical protein
VVIQLLSDLMLLKLEECTLNKFRTLVREELTHQLSFLEAKLIDDRPVNRVILSYPPAKLLNNIEIR